MIAADEGWEMAFYWSPLVFMAIDWVIILGAILGLIGLVIGPGVSRRAQSAVGAMMSVGTFFVVPWR